MRRLGSGFRLAFTAERVIEEGICEILAGTNPRALREKLRAMLPPGEAQLSAA